MNMLVHQCSSCGTISGHKGFSDSVPALPLNWTRITVDMAWDKTRSKTNYDLCGGCSSKPIKFGNIEVMRNKQ